MESCEREGSRMRVGNGEWKDAWGFIRIKIWKRKNKRWRPGLHKVFIVKGRFLCFLSCAMEGGASSVMEANLFPGGGQQLGSYLVQSFLTNAALEKSHGLQDSSDLLLAASLLFAIIMHPCSHSQVSHNSSLCCSSDRGKTMNLEMKREHHSLAPIGDGSCPISQKTASNIT